MISKSENYVTLWTNVVKSILKTIKPVCFLGLCGQMVSNMSPIMYCLEDTKPDGAAPCICGFILADHARDLMHLTKEQRYLSYQYNYFNL